jgi:hypothetical protein
VDNVTPRATSKGRCAACANLLEARTSSALRCGTCGNIGRPPDKCSPATHDTTQSCASRLVVAAVEIVAGFHASFGREPALTRGQARRTESVDPPLLPKLVAWRPSHRRACRPLRLWQNPRFEETWCKSNYNCQPAPTNLLTTQKVTADVMAAKIVPHATSTRVSCKVQFRSVAWFVKS